MSINLIITDVRHLGQTLLLYIFGVKHSWIKWMPNTIFIEIKRLCPLDGWNTVPDNVLISIKIGNLRWNQRMVLFCENALTLSTFAFVSILTIYRLLKHELPDLSYFSLSCLALNTYPLIVTTWSFIICIIFRYFFYSENGRRISRISRHFGDL